MNREQKRAAKRRHLRLVKPGAARSKTRGPDAREYIDGDGEVGYLLNAVGVAKVILLMALEEPDPQRATCRAHIVRMLKLADWAAAEALLAAKGRDHVIEGLTAALDAGELAAMGGKVQPLPGALPSSEAATRVLTEGLQCVVGDLGERYERGDDLGEWAVFITDCMLDTDRLAMARVKRVTPQGHLGAVIPRALAREGAAIIDPNMGLRLAERPTHPGAFWVVVAVEAQDLFGVTEMSIGAPTPTGGAA